MKAWHFVRNDRKLGYGDNSIVEVGKTYKCEFPYTHKGETCDKPTLCKAGMHGSEKILDALYYAAGNIICRVELSGDIVRGDDKVVARERKVLAMIDGEKVLRKFACMCALDVIDKRDAAEIFARYLKTQDESIRAAALAAAWAEPLAATWSEARKKQNARLTRMVNKAIRDANNTSCGVNNTAKE